MSETTPTFAERQAYSHHHRDEDYFTDTPPQPAPVFRGQFKRGFDPRRHQFTAEERSRGWWTAIAIFGVGIGAKLHQQGRWPNYKGARG